MNKMNQCIYKPKFQDLLDDIKTIEPNLKQILSDGTTFINKADEEFSKKLNTSLDKIRERWEFINEHAVKRNATLKDASAATKKVSYITLSTLT